MLRDKRKILKYRRRRGVSSRAMQQSNYDMKGIFCIIYAELFFVIWNAQAKEFYHGCGKGVMSETRKRWNTAMKNYVYFSTCHVRRAVNVKLWFMIYTLFLHIFATLYLPNPCVSKRSLGPIPTKKMFQLGVNISCYVWQWQG